MSFRHYTKPLLIGAVATIIFVVVGLLRPEHVTREAVVLDMICRYLLGNTTVGRQAVVSSMWWPPLHALARLPFAILLPVRAVPLSSLLVSSVCGVAVLGLLHRILREWAGPGARWILLAGLALHPAFLRACTDGSTVTLTLLLMMSTAYGMAGWLEHKRLRFLVVLALSCGLLSLASVELGPWLLVVIVVLAVDVTLNCARADQREAVVIMALTPLLYALGLWFLFNWLVMGDPAYFLRSMLSGTYERYTYASDDVAPRLLHSALVIVCLGIAIWSATTKRRAGVYLGVLAASPLAMAVLLAANGLSWGHGALLGSLLPLTIMVIGYAAGHLKPPSHWARRTLLAVPLLVAFVGHAGWGGAGIAQVRERRADAVETRRFVEEVRRHVLSRSRYARVFVCGYDGLALDYFPRGDVFVNTLDFDFSKTRREYVGQRLYLLVHRPEARSGMDSLHWKYNRIYALGAATTLADRQWDDWRLFEIIQAPALTSE